MNSFSTANAKTDAAITNAMSVIAITYANSRRDEF
jgi:hypothetical protein